MLLTVVTVAVPQNIYGYKRVTSESNIKTIQAERSNVLEDLSTNLSKSMKYKDYIDTYSDKDFNGSEIMLAGNSYKTGEGIEDIGTYEGKENVVLSKEQGSLTWEVDVLQAGLYSIQVDYYPVKGYGSTIIRNLLINGELPFEEAKGIELTRMYADEEPDPSGKLVRPNQTEVYRWNTVNLTDSFAYFGDAIYIYLKKGTNSLTLVAEKEPVAIASVKLISKNTAPKSYEEVLQQYRDVGISEVSGVLEEGILVIQAENSYEKADPTLHGRNDRTSTKMQPFSYKDDVLNHVGGHSWKYPGQWISWKVNIPVSGLYYIGARSLQNYIQDVYGNRTLYIDGKIPFAEAANIQFHYHDDWAVDEFGEEIPYLFYLEAGERIITLKHTAGDLRNILTKADSILENLNKINIDFLALLSTTPDTDRDYQIETYMPDTLKELGVNREGLQEIYDEMILKTGKNDKLTSQLQQLISLLTRMYENPNDIPRYYTRYRELVGNFGNWIMMIREHALALDYLYIAEADAKVDKSKDGFLTKIWTGIVQLYYSFFYDNTLLSGTEDTLEDKETITVWIGSGITGGRDQAVTLNEMIRKDFTAKHGIEVKVQLVPENTILMTTLAGRGPDVVLQVNTSVPVDFALRNAAYDLTQFKDYKEIEKRFFESAAEPFKYNGGVYALPETMSYNMLFYRTDILNDLGIDVSQLKTWDSIIEILQILQGQNMNFGLPSVMASYSMFLYQMGGEYYTRDNKSSALSSQIALDAFQYWTDFYKEYNLPIDFSFENRFRTGEIPIGIQDYTAYNLLSISAPEIKGKWAMTELPGIVDKDGYINNTSPTLSKGCILMNSSEHKDTAWEFMKWWTEAEVQYEFGSQLEAVMGTAARYNTANIEALQQMPWAAVDRIGLMEQANNLRGIPQVPGGYYTERNVNFATLSVINDEEDPRTQLTKYTKNITDEISMKRLEFGLD